MEIHGHDSEVKFCPFCGKKKLGIWTKNYMLRCYSCRMIFVTPQIGRRLRKSPAKRVKSK